MEELVQFCSECVPLSNKQIENHDNKRRLRSISAMFLGMKDNVHRVLQTTTNGSFAITNRMDQWVRTTVQEARVLVKLLQEQPPQLGFFAKGCLGFCATSSDSGEEAADRKMAERVNTLLAKAFVIQSAIYCQETTVIVDIQDDISVDSARQEFLGCVYDFNKRLSGVTGASEEGFKALLAQVSGEYQKRQDVRTEAGKRAFIRWHKAANDMIKTQLQQKLSEREMELNGKDQRIKEDSNEITNLQHRNKELEIQLQNKTTEVNTASQKELEELMSQLALLKKEKADLAEQLAGKAELEVLLATKEKSEKELSKNLEVQKSETSKLEATCTISQQRVIDLEQQVNESKKSEEQTTKELVILKEELEASKQINTSLNEKTVSLEKDLGARVSEINALKEQLKTAENHKANGISNLNSLNQQLKEKEEELSDLQKETAEMEDELKSLRAKVENYETERIAMSDTMTKMTTELQLARDEAKEKEARYKSWDAEMKALREQLKEKQDEVVRLLEHNVELEETCRGFQQRISAKEEEIMKVEQQLAEMEEETKRVINEKTEAVETLERKVKRLSTNLDNAKKDLKTTKAELEETQSKL